MRERSKSGRHNIVRRSDSEASRTETSDDKRESGERVIPTSWGSGSGSGPHRRASRSPSGSHDAASNDDESNDDRTQEINNVSDMLDDSDG
jgi:hypothetical protein